MGDGRSGVRHRAGAAVVVALAALLAACGGGTASLPAAGPASSASGTTSLPVAPDPLPQPVQRLDIVATEYTFTMTPPPPGALRPGWTLLTFHNAGAEAHQVMFARIKDGVNMTELAAAAANDSSGAGAIAFVDMIGGVSYIDAGKDITALVNLTEGAVMAMCYVPDATGVAHALKGMTNALTVSGETTGEAASRPEPVGASVDGTIELTKDGYRFPERMGRGWYHVRNTDDALHEVSLMRLGGSLSDDRTAMLVEDLAANRTPPVTLEAYGGMGAISAGFDGYLHLDLAPGDYLAVDFMPDPGRPRPHMLDGYWARFRVER